MTDLKLCGRHRVGGQRPTGQPVTLTEQYEGNDLTEPKANSLSVMVARYRGKVEKEIRDSDCKRMIKVQARRRAEVEAWLAQSSPKTVNQAVGRAIAVDLAERAIKQPVVLAGREMPIRSMYHTE